MPATYKDIQRKTGFSLSTISRYFNGKKVKPATRRAIEDAASGLNFRMNDFARGLKSRKAMSVGLLIPDLDSIFCTAIMYKVGRILRQHGYSCIICDCSSDKQVEIEAMNFLLSKSVDGVISIPLDTDSTQLELARVSNVPVVLIDRAVPSFETDIVMIDNYAAGKMAGEYIHEMGHRNVAVISGPVRLNTMTERQRGFLSIFEHPRAGHSIRIINTETTYEDVSKTVADFLANLSDTTALFCTYHELTAGIIAAMNEMGIRFPDDISVIGFDNLYFPGLIKPALTYIEQPIEQISQNASDLLLRRLENGMSYPYETMMLEPKLIKGASVTDLR